MLNWKKYRKITIDKTKIDATLEHFPITLKLGEEVGLNEADVRSIFDEVGANWKKIAITKADGETQLYVEKELWDNDAKKAVLHISRGKEVVISGATTPSEVNGTYQIKGIYEGKNAYYNGYYWIWWDGADTWNITDIKGSGDVKFNREDESPFGAYDADEGTGTPIAVNLGNELGIDDEEDTEIYFYYDNNQDDNDGYIGETQSTPAKRVWNGDFLSRVDMKDKTTSLVEDSTSNANHGTKKGANEPLQIDGKVGKAQDFDGSNDFIKYNNFSPPVNYWTYSVWASFDAINSNALIFVAMTSSSTGRNITLRVNSASKKPAIAIPYVAAILESSSVLNTGTYYHLTFIRNGSDWAIYVNGAPAGTASNSTSQEATTNVYMGGSLSAAGGIELPWLNGKIDEFRVSNIARSPAWIKATYNSLNDTLVSWGEEETPSPVGTNITIDGKEVKSITIDGQEVKHLTIDGKTVF